jgi:hypothetical protein
VIVSLPVFCLKFCIHVSSSPFMLMHPPSLDLIAVIIHRADQVVLLSKAWTVCALLEHWDHGFESLSRHGCLSAFILSLCCSVCR